MTEKLDILVVEDSSIHQQSARDLLKDYNLTIVGTFDEAADVICGGPRGDKSSKRRYDAVLTDMFIPQGRGDSLRDRSQAGIEMPFGYAIALMACKEGVQNVAIVSDADHHANAIAYTMDFFSDNYHESLIQQIGKSRLAVIKSAQGLAKDWKAALDYVRNGEIFVPEIYWPPTPAQEVSDGEPC